MLAGGAANCLLQVGQVSTVPAAGWELVPSRMLQFGQTSTICYMRLIPAKNREGELSEYNHSASGLLQLPNIGRVSPRYWRQIPQRAKMHGLFTGTF